MEIKLKNKKVKVKKLTVDEKDTLLDNCKFIYDEKGNYQGIEAVHSTMTKFIRIGLEGDTSDKFIESLSFEDKTVIFAEMQNLLLQGEKKPSK